MNKKHYVVPDLPYHSMITVHLTDSSSDLRKDPLNDINYRQLVTKKITSYLTRFLVPNGSKKYRFGIQYVYERKINKRFHLHILITRLDTKIHLSNKLIQEYFRDNELDTAREDYDLIDKAMEYVFRKMKINGRSLVMEGENAFDIRRIPPNEGRGYVSKYLKQLSWFEDALEYEPIHSVGI